jgi:hypothetical protein
MTHLGRLFSQARSKLGIGIVDVARRAGYRNLNKGMRRYTQIENGSDIFPVEIIRQRFCKVLGLDDADLLGAMAADFEELDRPVPPRLIVRLAFAFYVEEPLPEGCTREEAEAYAERVARERDRSVCVTLSEIRSLFISPNGKKSEAYCVPVSTLPTLEGLRAASRISSIKERFRLVAQVSSTPREGTASGTS